MRRRSVQKKTRNLTGPSPSPCRPSPPPPAPRAAAAERPSHRLVQEVEHEEREHHVEGDRERRPEGELHLPVAVLVDAALAAVASRERSTRRASPRGRERSANFDAKRVAALERMPRRVGREVDSRGGRCATVTAVPSARHSDAPPSTTSKSAGMSLRPDGPRRRRACTPDTRVIREADPPETRSQSRSRSPRQAASTAPSARSRRRRRPRRCDRRRLAAAPRRTRGSSAAGRREGRRPSSRPGSASSVGRVAPGLGRVGRRPTADDRGWLAAGDGRRGEEAEAEADDDRNSALGTRRRGVLACRCADQPRLGKNCARPSARCQNHTRRAHAPCRRR